MILRGGSGLGDSIYLFPIAKWLKSKGEDVTVTTYYPDVFSDLDVKTIRFRKKSDDFNVHPGRRRPLKTKIFEDIAILGGCPDVELKLDWKVKNQKLIDDIKGQAKGRKIMLVGAPREPFGRHDHYGLELMPEFKVMNNLIFLNRKEYFKIMVGRGQLVHPIDNLDLNLMKKTTVRDVMDIATITDVLIGQNGYFIPLSESLNKKSFIIYSYKGLTGKDKFIAAITPQKILLKKTTGWVIDNEPIEEINKKFQEHMK